MLLDQLLQLNNVLLMFQKDCLNIGLHYVLLIGLPLCCYLNCSESISLCYLPNKWDIFFS